MKLLRVCFLAAAAWLLAGAGERPVHIFMAGDSTMADKPLLRFVTDSITGESIAEPHPERGWGQMFPYFFTDKVKVVNEAQNGRSTRTFIEEGRWAGIVERLQPGDFAIIQFGHNDAAENRPEKYTSPEGYRRNLEMMVRQTREKGATPILCTPVARRRFDAQGKFYDTHGVYPGIVREVADQMNVTLVDMHARSMVLLEYLGPEGSVALFMHVPAGVNRNFPQGVEDNTHFITEGAIKMAEIFIDGLVDLDVEALTKYRK